MTLETILGLLDRDLLMYSNHVKYNHIESDLK